MEEEIILAGDQWINAGGFILIAIGIAILFFELFLPSFGLFGFAGATAILIGIIQLHLTGYIEEMPISLTALIIMAVIGFILAGTGGYFSFKLYQKQNVTGVEAMIGAEATVIYWKDKEGKIRIMGEEWQAYSDDKHLLIKGDIVLVSKVDGLKIKISYTDSKF